MLSCTGQAPACHGDITRCLGETRAYVTVLMQMRAWAAVTSEQAHCRQIEDAVTTWPEDEVSQCVLPMVLLISSADFDNALRPGASSPGAMQSSYANLSVPPTHVLCSSDARKRLDLFAGRSLPLLQLPSMSAGG